MSCLESLYKDFIYIPLLVAIAYLLSITAVDSIVGSKSVLRALVMAKAGWHIMRSFSDKGQVCEEACCEIDVVLLMAFP